MVEPTQLMVRGIVNSGIAGLYFFNNTVESFRGEHPILGSICLLALVMSLHDVYVFYKTSNDIFKSKNSE